MGLEISVGMLYAMARNDEHGLRRHEAQFAELSRVLGEQGISWQEPERTDPPSTDVYYGGFPHSYLTALRRVLALGYRREPVTPMPPQDSADYERELGKIDDEASMLVSHLLCHADDSGYYVPVKMTDPLFLSAATLATAKADVGTVIGSSMCLLVELVFMAPLLGVTLEEKQGQGFVLSAEETARLAATAPDDPYAAEKTAWHQLYLACRASVFGGHAIVFS